MNQFRCLLVGVLQFWEIRSFFEPEKSWRCNLCASENKIFWYTQSIFWYTFWYTQSIFWYTSTQKQSNVWHFEFLWLFWSFTFSYKMLKKRSSKPPHIQAPKITKCQIGPYRAFEVVHYIAKRSSQITILDRKSVESNFFGIAVTTPWFRHWIYLL